MLTQFIFLDGNASATVVFEFMMSSAKMGYAFDFDCPQSIETLQNVPKTNFLNEHHSWLIWSSKNNFIDEFRVISLSLCLQSDVILASFDSDSSVTLTDAYMPSESAPINCTQLGHWSLERGLQGNLNEPKTRSRRNLFGQTVTAGIELLQSQGVEEMLLNPFFARNQDAESRRTFKLFTHVAELYNFNLKLRVFDSVGVPTGAGNGTYDGLIGSLQRKETDLGLAMLRRDLKDVNSLGYVRVPLGSMALKSGFVYLHHRRLPWYSLGNMYFSENIWAATGALLISYMLGFKFLAKFDRENLQEMSSLVFISAIMSQQGFPVETNWASSRLLALSSLVFGFFLYTYYNTAVLIQILSVQTHPVMTLDIFLSDDITVGAENTSQNYLIFSNSSVDPHIQKLQEVKMNSTETFVPITEGLKRVREANYAYVTDLRKLFGAAADTFSDYELYSLVAVELFPPASTPRSIGVQMDSPYEEFFSFGSSLLVERGILTRTDKLWDIAQPRCDRQIFLPVKLEEVLFAFVLLIAGMMCSLLLLAVEKGLLQLPSTAVSTSSITRRFGHGSVWSGYRQW
nr:PREDICTED: probable glutamate receptor [Bemisia tabaci]